MKIEINNNVLSEIADITKAVYLKIKNVPIDLEKYKFLLVQKDVLKEFRDIGEEEIKLDEYIKTLTKEYIDEIKEPESVEFAKCLFAYIAEIIKGAKKYNQKLQQQIILPGEVKESQYEFTVSSELFNKIQKKDFCILEYMKNEFKDSVKTIFDKIPNGQKIENYNKFGDNKLIDPFFALSDEDNEHKIKINLPLIKAVADEAVADSNDKELVNNIKDVFNTFFKQYFVIKDKKIAERLGAEEGVSPNVRFDGNEDSGFFNYFLDFFISKNQELALDDKIGNKIKFSTIKYDFSGDQEVIDQEVIDQEVIDQEGIEQEITRIRELINGFNFDNVDEFKLPTSPFIIKKFANDIIEIINDDNHIQINAKNGPASLEESLYRKIINSQNVDDLLKNGKFQNGLKGVIGESEKYLLSFKNRLKPCYSYRQEKANNSDSYDSNSK